LVGSTPGKSTKNIGEKLLVSTNVSSILNAGDSVNFSPYYSATKDVKAEITLSGRRALKSKSLWNLLISLKAFGRSAYSAFSSPYHFFHYSTSVSKD